MRWNLLFIAVVALGLSTPCSADYVLLWTSSTTFPGSAHPSSAPLAPRYLGELDGTPGLEIVVQPVDYTSVLEIRDAMTGVLEGSLDLYACCGGYFKSVAFADLSGDGLEELLVTMGSVGQPPINRFAVFQWQSVAGVTNDRPADGAALLSANPNPFKQRTLIDFTSSATGKVEVSVFDVAGRVVRKLDAGHLRAGSHQIEWDGKDGSNSQLSAGTYFFTLRVNGQVVGVQKTVMLQ